LSYEPKFFFCKWREQHFIVTTSSIVKKKIVLMKKNFAFETAHLFISLWSLSGKNLLFRTKLDLCTAVDNFPVIALLPDREIRSLLWLALLSRLSYVGILETPPVLLTPLALSIESAVALFLGGEDLMMPVGSNRFAC
jgi:hypothetical protein